MSGVSSSLWAGGEAEGGRVMTAPQVVTRVNEPYVSAALGCRLTGWVRSAGRARAAARADVTGLLQGTRYNYEECSCRIVWHLGALAGWDAGDTRGDPESRGGARSTLCHVSVTVTLSLSLCRCVHDLHTSCHVCVLRYYI